MATTSRNVYSFKGQAVCPTSFNKCKFDNIIDNFEQLLPNNIQSCLLCDVSMNNIVYDKSNNLLIIHLNISSLQKHIDDLHEFLVCLPYRPDVLCISETRIADVPSINVSINSPTIVGGVGLYVSQDLKCEITTEFSINVDGVDELWAEISGRESHSNIKRLICPYRHPSQKNLDYFFNNLNNCLLSLNSKCKIFYILGDININTLCDSRQLNYSKMYKLILKSNGCYLIINKPTHLTMRSKTSIDHILTNDSDLNITPGIIDYHISDHLFVFAVLQFNKFYNLEKNKKAIITPMKFRKIKNFDATAYRDNLDFTLHSYINHLPVITPENYMSKFEAFNNVILQIINKHAPITTVSRKQKRLMSKPWITKGLFVSIRHKQSLYKTHFKSNNIEKIMFFKKYSNKLTHLKSICKKRYFHEKISNNADNPNLVWKTLKFILPSVKSDDNSTINLKVNGIYYDKPDEVAEHFNDFFVNIGQKLANEISSSEISQCKSFLNDKVKNTIF